MSSVDDLGRVLEKISLEDKNDSDNEILPEDAQALLTSIKKLECPFTWKPSGNVSHEAHINRIEEKLEEIFEDDEIILLWHTFFLQLVACYEYYCSGSVDGALSKEQKMEDILSKAKQDVPNSSCSVAIGGLQHVVLSCKCFLQFKSENYSDATCTYRMIVPFSEMNNKDKASVWGARAAVFMEYGYEGTTTSLDYIEKAIKLDETEAEWYFLQGKALGRIRRIERYSDVPEDKEIDSLQKAFDLTSDVPYMLFLAQALRENASRLYSLHKNNYGMIKAKCENLNDRACTLYKNALALRKDCSHVNLRVAQGFLKMPSEYRDMALIGSCIKNALHMGPTNPMANHVAGNYYERMNASDIARQHYLRAIEGGAYGAYMDLLRLNSRSIPNYDPSSDFERLLLRFNEKPLLCKTHIVIGSYWYFVKRNFKEAFKYWKNSLSEDPTAHDITNHKSVFLRMKTPINIHDIVFQELSELVKDESIPDEDREEMLTLVEEYSKSGRKISSESLQKKVLDAVSTARFSFSQARGRARSWNAQFVQRSCNRRGNSTGCLPEVGQCLRSSDQHEDITVMQTRNTSSRGCFRGESNRSRGWRPSQRAGRRRSFI